MSNFPPFEIFFAILISKPLNMISSSFIPFSLSLFLALSHQHPNYHQPLYLSTSHNRPTKQNYRRGGKKAQQIVGEWHHHRTYTKSNSRNTFLPTISNIYPSREIETTHSWNKKEHNSYVRKASYKNMERREEPKL